MVKLVVPRVHWTGFVPSRCLSAKPKAILDDETLNLISNNDLKYRHHPGIVKPRTPVFPAWASKETENILKEKNNISLKELKESVKKLLRHLHGRHPPLEQSQLLEKLQKVEKHLNANRNQNISIKDIDFHKNRRARQILKTNVYNWQPINFDKLTSFTYLLSRGVQNYAVIRRILDEIRARDKEFKPRRLFDFGSGLGTVMWAASEIWSDSLKEYLCVEVSEPMIELSERLAKVATPEIKKIFYRQYFPVSADPTYDIVVSAYSLFDLPGAESRLETILKLWRKTKDYLIIVEEGTNAGFKLVNEARDFILKYVNSKYKRDIQFAHIFSPCPHDLKCPRFATDVTPCNFEVLYHPFKFLDSHQHESELYSYVVLKKSKRTEDDEQWPRIVRETMNRSNHTICRMCTSNGELKEEIFTKYKHGRHMYRCARNSKWGDRLPLHWQDVEEIDTSNETIIENTK
ncbi:methyltransferase-like protein 17, mitochondrial [Pseudomyrmex gracilis]|uniref:methyltransferase-like protein 17, mitochondrial n=1 Tax=Pseudomyrmex gracilis TaxID=219809 RepID=UPI00099499C7|nr:methyltransferase-like protein 17, mitochondrial [Pseudomyrmex gracilis]XP_020291007.1 methyltransferase-like protein 17, mitochondrial [Pseudomyrmex gracilis]